jgi:hypothetical protein
MRRLITISFLLILAASLAAVSYSKQSHVWLTNSLIDSSPIGVSSPSTGNFTAVTSGSGATSGGYGFSGHSVTDGLFSTGNGIVNIYANNNNVLHLDGTNFAASTITANASTATALAADPGRCAAGQVSQGVNASGTSTCVPAVQSASALGCTTAASSFSTCTTTLSWPVAYADTTYKVVCSGINANDPRASINGVNKSTGSVTVTTVTNGSNSASYAEIDCEAKS